jgi:hypothetical protein
MTRVRAIGTELVERKLWPVALALLIAAIALPIALSGGGGDSSAPTVPVTGGTPANAQPAAVVSLTDAVSSDKRSRKGSVRDPFVQQHVAKATSAAGVATGSTSGSPVTNLTPASPLDINYGANPVAGDSTPSTVSPTATAPTTVLPTGSNVYHAVIRVKQLGKVRYLHDVARYDHVPSDKQRYMLFLGVLADRRTAVFSMMTPGYFYGNARCRPSRKFCATIEMRAGTSELLTLPQSDGSVRRVRVTLIRIFAKKVKASSAKASASRAAAANRSYSASLLK